MPLALELAAGLVDLLSLAEIAAEIERSLDFLETELSDVPKQHRGIRAVFDSTWEGLDENEREVLARFSVFRDGCTRDASRTVIGASLRMLASLGNKSLIQYRSADGRYDMHELCASMLLKSCLLSQILKYMPGMPIVLTIARR